MGHIRTIEDGYQYRIHNILRKAQHNMDLSNSEMLEFLNGSNADGIIGAMILEDIEQYCGIEEALTNEV